MSAGNRANTHQETRSRAGPRPLKPQPAGDRRGRGAAGRSPQPLLPQNKPMKHPRDSILNGGEDAVDRESRTKATSRKTSQ